MQNNATQELWEEVETLLFPHHKTKKTDRTAVDIMNRLVAKHLGRKPETRLTKTNCSIRSESWSLSELTKVKPVHSKNIPRKSDKPMIYFEYYEKLFLIDGNTRVNERIEKSDEGPHRILRINHPEKR